MIQTHAKKIQVDDVILIIGVKDRFELSDFGIDGWKVCLCALDRFFLLNFPALESCYLLISAAPISQYEPQKKALLMER